MDKTPATSLASQYQASAVEPQVHTWWQEHNAFAARPEDPGDPYSIVIPPPNVTAALHMGHALNNTLQDILTRYHRMRGFNTCWFPGTDHAGIATQTVVEKRVLQEEGKRRTDFDRESFVAKIQAWKDEYEERITDQLVAMGCSCDWQRQAFTLDDVRARAVREAFFGLFKDGLIYRGKRLVNWDPVTQTALADDEVEMVEIDGHFWYMKYPLVDAAGHDTGEHVTVATTRPETMLGDTAVAVNPNDAARKHLIGQHVRLPIVNRIIPIIGDDYVVIPNPESEDAKAKFASGFLKVTPAHDPNDYEIGRRHDLELINVMAPDGTISRNHGWPAEENIHEAAGFLGLDRYEAREAIVAWFRTQGLLEEVRPYRHSVGHSYRSHVAIEPYLSDQWYVKVTDDRLSGAALRAMAPDQKTALRADDGRDVRPTIKPKTIKPWEGGLHFHPARYAKTFQLWHENIRDWCISRQLWWGHRIPVWSFWPAASQDMPDPQIANQDEFAKRFHKALTELEKAFGLKDVFCFKYSSENGSGYLAARTEQAVQILSTLESYIATTSGPNSVGKPPFADADKDSASFRMLELVGPEFTQDPDVLDTWFSSALWPLSTMGWPDITPELEKWNPTNVLCTAREIITLWVSRMVMFNLYFTDRLPFRDVFIHAMIQDGHGQKMSKSLGNGVDPMDIIHSHGSDAMRYTLASMTTHTQDVRMPVDLVDPHSGQAFTPKFIRTNTGHMVAGPVQDSPADAARKMVSSFGLASGQATPDAAMPLARNTSEKFDHGRNFANKLWNAARFAMTHLDVDDGDFKPDQPGRIGPRHSELTIVSHWILSRLGRTVRQCEKAIAHYEFAQYSQVLYDFFWRDLCDWYIEAIKPTVRQSHAQRHALATCLDVSLRLMHPVMPFITERLFAALNETFPRRGVEGITIPPAGLLVKAAWPTVDAMILRPDVEAEFAKVQNVVTMIREVRTTMKVPPRQRVEVSGRVNADYLVPALLEKVWVEHLANVEVVAMDTDVTKPEGAAVVVRPNVEIYLHNQLDAETERTRLTGRLAEIRKSIQTLQGRLASASYVQKAPPHLVEQTKSQLADNQAELVGIERQLADLPSV